MRLAPLLQRYNLADVDSLVRRLELSAERELVREVIEAMTTNETFFFRDRAPFDNFREVILPRLMEARSEQTTHPYLVCSLFDRTGTLFACDDTR